jgi:glycogen(starch) synthase
MKVLMTADTLGGVWTYALELCAAMPRVEFVLASLGAEPSAAQRAAAAALDNVCLESRTCRLEWMPDCEADLADTAEWLLALAACHEPDLVHLNDYAHASLPFGVPVMVVAHSCVVSWWRAVHGTPPPAEWTNYRERVETAFAAADAVVAPTQSFLREVIALYGAPRRAYTIYNAARAREPFAGVPSECSVLGAGRLWDEAKNVATLDHAAQELGFPVYVAGETRAPHGRALELRAVRALGRLEPHDLGEWMQRCAVFASPAVYEPFGLATLEAAFNGSALVLGDIPSLRELWQGAAAFVPPRDCAALRRTLRALLEDATTRGYLAARARKRARLFLPERMATGYAALYRELVPHLSEEAFMEAVA